MLRGGGINPASPIRALGSYLGCLTAKRTLGQGCRIRGLGRELVRQLRYLRPYQACPLAAPAQPPMPEDDDAVAKCSDRRAIGRHGMVGEIPGDDLPEPFPGFRNWPVHSSSQRFLDFPELPTHAVAARLPFDLEIAPSGFAAPQSGRTQSGGSCPHEATARTAAAFRASRPRSAEHRSHAGKPTTRSSAYLIMIMSLAASPHGSTSWCSPPIAGSPPGARCGRTGSTSRSEHARLSKRAGAALPRHALNGSPAQIAGGDAVVD